MEYRGIDVSKWQGSIDWSRVKNSGVEFAIIRIGYGMYENQKDSQFENNYASCLKNNIPVGVYLYSYALNENDAKKEAEVVLKWLNGRQLNLPVYYDIEDKTQQNLSKKTLTNMCISFCEEIEKAGYWAGVYANKYWFTNLLDGSELGNRFTCWVAQYNSVNTYAGKYDMWQYTSSGSVDGIDGNVDLNILYRDIFTNTIGKVPVSDLPNLSDYKGVSIVDALKQNGVDSSFENRKRLYALAGFTDEYVGSAIQNLNLLNKLGANVDVTSNYYPVPRYNGNSIVDALKSIDVDSSFENRKRIAAKNKINNYRGTSYQNSKMLKLLKRGQLLKV